MSTNTQLAKVSPAALAIGTQFGYTPEYVALVKNTIAKDATDDELSLFLGVCHHAKLNPMNREIYFWKSGGKVVIHTGIQGLRIAADRTGRYTPGKISRQTDANGKLISSTATIKKLVAGQWFEIEETANWTEWVKPGDQWSDKRGPHQLDITAERHALRKAFPQLVPIDTTETLGDDPASFADTAPEESAADADRRAILTADLVKAGQLFLSPEQLASLEATLPTAPLATLEGRYQKAEEKLREFVLSEIGKVFQGEAYSEFIVKSFPNSIEGADCKALFAVLDSVKEASEAGHIDGEVVSEEDEKRVELEQEIMTLVNTKAEGDLEKINEILDGRTLQSMTTERLEAFLEGLKKEDAPF